MGSKKDAFFYAFRDGSRKIRADGGALRMSAEKLPAHRPERAMAGKLHGTRTAFALARERRHGEIPSAEIQKVSAQALSAPANGLAKMRG